jgi:hypothetical protein
VWCGSKSSSWSVVIAAFLVGLAAPIAAFMATKAAGGTDLHPQRELWAEALSGGPKGADYFVSRCKGGSAADGK